MKFKQKEKLFYFFTQPSAQHFTSTGRSYIDLYLRLSQETFAFSEPSGWCRAAALPSPWRQNLWLEYH